MEVLYIYINFYGNFIYIPTSLLNFTEFIAILCLYDKSAHLAKKIFRGIFPAMHVQSNFICEMYLLRMSISADFIFIFTFFLPGKTQNHQTKRANMCCPNKIKDVIL